MSINDSNSDIRVGYAVLEDNVGPYVQQNYYSGGSHGEMGGFEDEPKVVGLIFNDVVRSYYGCEGLPESLPTEIKKGEEYVHECRIPLTNVTNKEEVSVVAMLIDATTGEIINGAKKKNPVSAVGIIETSNGGKIDVEGRTITLREADMDAELFSVDGKKVATLKPNVALSVESGIYVAKIGSKSIKLMVK